MAQVQLIQSDAELDRLCRALGAAERVSADTEFHPERAYHPRLMLLQFGVEGQEPFVVDALAGLDLRRLGPPLSRVPLIVHGGQADLAILARHCEAAPRAVLDTQIMAGFAGMGWPRRLQDVLEPGCGVRLEKTETLSDWSRRPLDPAQLRYAADDVRWLPALADALAARIEALGNSVWADLAQEDARTAALAPPDDSAAWRRVPGAHLLGDVERSALAALAAWREGVARRLDQQVGQLVADSILLDLARRRPTSVDRMRDNRRMPSQVYKQHGAAILAVLAAAATAAPPPPLPRGARADVVRAAARAAAGARGMAVELVLDECELHYTLMGSPPANWRRPALGSDFEKFMLGSLSLWVDGRLA